MAHVATVTIDSDQVPADATNFPAYINLAHLFAGSASFASTVANGGGDIRVFQGATELAREVVSCRPGTFFDFSGSSLPTGFSNTTDTWLAASDYIRPGGSTGRNIFADFGAADGTAIGIVNNTTALAGHYGGLLFRQYDADNYWVTDIDFNAGSLRLYKRVAGSATVVDTASVSVSLNTEHEVKVLFSGNDITVYLDGVAKITATDSFNASATTHGLRGNQTGLRFYEFHFIAEQETTGTGELHVLIPFLDSSQDTVLSIYADGSSADYAVDDPFGRNAVWGDYSRVFHLRSLVDSTGNSSDLTAVATASVDDIDSPLGRGATLDGNSDYFTGDNPSYTTGDFTLQAWVKTSDVARNDIATAGDGGPGSERFGLNQSGTGVLSGAIDDGSSAVFPSGSTSLTDNAWHSTHAVFDRSASIYGYVDGSLDYTSASISGVGSVLSAEPLYIGARDGGVGVRTDQVWDGALSEVRFRPSDLSANWITTEYNNQSDPSSFYTATDPNAGGSESISPDSLYQSVSIEGVTLTQAHVLAAANLAQLQAIGAATLAQANSIAPHGVDQTAGIESATLTQAHIIAPAGISQHQQIGTASLVSAGVLSVIGLAQTQTLDEAILTVAGALDVDGVSQSQVLEALTLVQNNILAPAGLAQEAALEATTINAAALGITPAGIEQVMAIGPTGLTQYHVLAVSDLAQDQILEAARFGGLVIGELAGKVVVYAALNSKIAILPALSGDVYSVKP
jgi:hypothetical protein